MVQQAAGLPTLTPATSTPLTSATLTPLTPLKSTIFIPKFRHSLAGCPALVPCDCLNQTIDCGSRRLVLAPQFHQHDLPFDKLKLNNNHITTVTNLTFRGLKVTEINLSFNRISTIDDDVFSGLETTLRVLNLEFNHLTSLPKTVFTLQNMEELDISHNRILSADQVDGQFLLMKKFMASGNLLTQWPNWLNRLPFLEELDLGYNPISTFPDNLSDLQWTLHRVTLDNCQFHKIPQQLSQLHRLEFLDFSFNPIGDKGIWYDSFHGQSGSLKELLLQSVNITAVPKALGSLSSLNKLDISDNNLGFIREDILPGQLTEVIMKSCGLHRIPATLSDLKNLKSLELANNHIQSIENHDLQGLSNLINLDLSSNNMQHVSPRAAVNLTRIQNFWLFDNKLTELPAVVQEFQTLKELNLEANPLQCTCRDGWPAVWITRHPSVQVKGYCENLGGLDALKFISNYNHYCAV
ncbi:leucine-rich repeat protein soc-2 homolog [Patella vulgata]|uniref:leucine-rich repeat protein soc-2 homolog n=1 Tax=Patella vulgata TaxID=6465 RepID=UPI00217F5336|nr:leucine-rich repeat protein soc-2 homolog [Patella vulgata]